MAKLILVVDDDPQTVQMIGYILRKQDYEVAEALSGAEALEAVARRRPDLMLLDLMMPDMDGIEVCRRVRADPKLAQMPVVVLTAKTHPADRAQGWQAGADDYITKPIDPTDLINRIRMALQRPGSDQRHGDLLTEIAHGVVMTLNAILAWVLVVSEDGRTLKSAATAAMAGEDMTRLFLRAIKGGPGDITFPLAKQISPLCEVALTDRALLDQTAAALGQMPGGDLLARGMETVSARTASVLPLIARGSTVGVLMVARLADMRLEAVDPRLLDVFASQAAMAVENARLIRKLEQQEQETRREKSFHQTLVNTMGDGLLMLDRNFGISFVNRRLCRMLGYEEAELVGRPLSNLIHEGDRSSAEAWLNRGGGTSSFEKRLVRKDGSWLSVLAVHVPSSQTDFGDVIVVTDLTEQKTRETALMRRTRQLTAINTAGRTMAASIDFDSILQTILEETVRVLGARGGSILLIDEANAALIFRAVVGPRSEGLLGLKLPFGQGVIGWVAKTGQPALVDDVRKDERFYRGIDQTTGLTTTNIVAVPLLIKRNVIGVLEMVNKVEGQFDEEDLSVTETLAQWAAVAIENAQLVHDLRARALELEKAYAELTEADKIKDELIQNVSHELRTPLTFILGYVELLAAGDLGPLTEAHVNALNIVKRKCMALTKVVNDIVALRRLEVAGLDRRPVSLNGLIAQAAEAARITAEKSVQSVAAELPPRDVVASIDEERVGQVLDNLLNNAIKFSPSTGRILLRLQDLEGDIRVEVEDQGIGIAPDKVERIFERFYQVDGSSTRRYGGVGLGLAICKEIVDAHGGKIWAESAPGRGSRFIFTLPKIATEISL